MATIVYTISSKADKVLGKHEILVRFFHGRINLRGKTGFFTTEEDWDQEHQCNRIPKIRVMSEDRKEAVRELTLQNGKLKELSQFILSTFLESGGGKQALGENWLKETLELFKNKDIVTQKPQEEEEEKPETLCANLRISFFMSTSSSGRTRRENQPLSTVNIKRYMQKCLRAGSRSNGERIR